MSRTLEQSLRNAIEVEKAAAAFYTRLAKRTQDEPTRAFFQEMAQQEEQHAASLEAVSKRLDAGDLPAFADDKVASVETAMGWEQLEGEMDLKTALAMAIEAENNAALYYDAMADFAQGEARELFRKLTSSEEHHAERLRKRLDALSS